ncbi:MAG: hypothetical protein AUK44_10455 [Porphyromonadaceae bacterium CG2_30_38_12]|nr:MAG: hypothetical protein AUK44_10455 [Porphyromonadaceae bacterium CG2_30_38_12]
MKRIFAKLGTFIFCIFISQSEILFSQTNSVLFDAWKANPATALLPDFSYAGYGYGEQLPPIVPDGALPVFNVNDFGAIPDDGLPDMAAIENAIDAATKAGGGIVKFGAGTYNLAQITNEMNGSKVRSIIVRASNIILRGAGSGVGGTVIFENAAISEYGSFAVPNIVNFAAPELKGMEHTYGLHEGDPLTNDWWFSVDATYEAFRLENTDDFLSLATSDAPRQSKSIDVAHPEKFFAGQLVYINMTDPLYHNEFFAPWDPSLFSVNNLKKVRRGRQIMTVQSVSGNTITFKERLRLDYKAQYNIVLAQYRYIQNVGLEDMCFESATYVDQSKTRPRASGVLFTNVYNGWAKNLKFVNVGSALSLSQCKNVTVDNCQYDITAAEPLERYTAGFHNSFKMLATTNDCLIKNLSYGVRPNWGPSLQESASGNVFLDVVLWNGDAGVGGFNDLHGGVPYSNLYDRTTNGYMIRCGGVVGLINGGPYNTWWNWNGKNNVTTNRNFPVFKNDSTTYDIRFVKPIIVGYRMQNTTASVSYVTASDGSPAYKPEVTTESIGTEVNPSSLYLAQLNERFGAPVAGNYAIITGANQLLINTNYSWSAANSVGTGLSYSWKIDGANAGVGTTFSYTFDTAGRYELSLVATSSNGTSISTSRTLWVTDKNAVVIAPFANAKPVSYTSIDAGRVWHIKPIYPGTGYYKAIADINGSAFGLRSGVHISASSVLGGHIYTELPAEGIDVSKLKYSYTITWEKKQSSLIRFIARDVNGNWAMSASNITLGTTAGVEATITGSLSTVSWTNTDAAFGLTTGVFDPTKVTAIGLCSKHSASWFIQYWLMKISDFQLMDARVATSVASIKNSKPTLSVSPNPVNDNLRIRFAKLDGQENLTIQITNMMGQLVEVKQACSVDNEILNHSVSNLPSGIYTVSVWSNAKRLGVSKFVKR